MKNKFLKNTCLFIALFSALLFASFTFQTNPQPIDYFNLPGPYDFYGDNYKLAQSLHGIEIYYKQCYLLQDEKIEKYQKMVFIELNKTVSSLNDVVNKKVKELENRKKTDLVCQYELSNEPDKGEYFLDYITSTGPKTAKKQVEWNVCRYKVFTAPAGRVGIAVFGFSMRGYDDKIYDFFDYQKANKDAIIAALKEYNFPEIQLKK